MIHVLAAVVKNIKNAVVSKKISTREGRYFFVEK